MKAIARTIGVTMTLAIGLSVLPALAGADEAKLPQSPGALMKALAEGGKPGPEHKKLEPFVGDWTLTVKVWTDPNEAPAEARGTVERKWIMGGRFVQETVKTEFAGKSFEGMGLLGYDNGQKKFTSARICGLCGTISQGFSSYDASSRKFECATEGCCPLTGQKVKGRDEVIIESNDKIITNVFKIVNGQEFKAMEFVSIRKK